jgi:molybdopterin-guanine dinucleotide biosynthesis protein A
MQKEKEAEREKAQARGEVAEVDKKPQPTVAEAAKDLQPDIQNAVKKNESKIKGFFSKFKH